MFSLSTINCTDNICCELLPAFMHRFSKRSLLTKFYDVLIHSLFSSLRLNILHKKGTDAKSNYINEVAEENEIFVLRCDLKPYTNHSNEILIKLLLLHDFKR